MYPWLLNPPFSRETLEIVLSSMQEQNGSSAQRSLSNRSWVFQQNLFDDWLLSHDYHRGIRWILRGRSRLPVRVPGQSRIGMREKTSRETQQQTLVRDLPVSKPNHS